jgi:hypothetical protein
MASYQAEVQTVSSGGFMTVTVESGSLFTARQVIQHIYNPITIRNLRQARGSNSSSSVSVGDIGSMGATISLIAIVWALVTFTPWVLMIFLGGFGTWVGEKLTGMSVSDYANSNEDIGHKRMALILALALFAGGVGFVQGHQFMNDTNTEVKTNVSK